MAKYRQIHTSFWQDGFVLDLTPEEKYFYIYLLTNSKTTQCGIYELPQKVIEIETGYNIETVAKLLQRFIDYGKIEYNIATKEIMVKNWIRYNPVNNINILKRVVLEVEAIKNESFAKAYMSMLPSDSLFDKEGLIRGLQGANKPLPSNRIKNKEEGIKSKEQRTKNKEQGESSGSSNSDLNIYLFMQKCGFVSISPVMMEKINADIELYSLEEVKAAVEIADNAGKHSYSYVRGILEKRRTGEGGKHGSDKQSDENSSANDYDFSKYTG